MSLSRHSEIPLSLALKPSNRLRRAMVLVHLLAGGACLANSLIMPAQFALCVMLGLHCWFVSKRLARPLYNQIRYSEQSGWEVAGFHGFESVRVLKPVLITTFIIILHIKSQNKEKLTILVLGDSLCKNDYRQLIVKLKTTVIKNKSKNGRRL